MFGDSLFHPALWHLNRRSAAGGVAVGLFCGLIPGPLQMLGAGIACVLFRVNLPVSLVTTLYTESADDRPAVPGRLPDRLVRPGLVGLATGHAAAGLGLVAAVRSAEASATG